MKEFRRAAFDLAVLVGSAFFLLLLAKSAFAQDALASGPLDFLKPLIESYGGKFGLVVQIFSYIATTRLVFFNLRPAIAKIIEGTASKVDDEILEKVINNKIYKFLVYFLDFTTSIKFPK